MFLKKYFRLSTLLYFLVLIFFSCGNNKKIVYFNNTEGQTNDSISALYFSPIYKKNDNLQITVNSSDLDVIKPFVNQTLSTGEANISNNILAGYLIDFNGEIDFPLIGKVKLEGLNRLQATELLKTKLKAYVSDANVNIRLLNFSYSVLGDVRNPSTYFSTKEQITILEAIAFAGDLTISAKRKNILIIREDNSKRKEIRLDLTSKNIHYQEGYYLKQNDVIYVQPNTLISSSTIIRNYIYFFLSAASAITTIFLLVSK